MNRIALPFLSTVAALAIAAAPVAQASVTSDFKAELKAKVGTKTGKSASKAAIKVVSKYVTAKFDPNKIKTFTKLAISAVKKDVSIVAEWSKKAMFSFFKKGIKEYNPSDKKYVSAQKLIYKLVKNNEAEVQKGFDQLENNHNKLKGTDAQLGELQEEVAKASGVTPVS